MHIFHMHLIDSTSVIVTLHVLTFMHLLDIHMAEDLQQF